MPLVFYEICNADAYPIYESEISKMPTSDPFWNPSEKISKNHLFPYF
jgi:hypothetical protein